MTSNSREFDRSFVTGLAWTGGIRWVGQLASWAITILVARLLTPADYGLVGMATVYLGFTQLLCEAGLSASLLRPRDDDPVAQAQLGGFAALLGVGCCLVSLLLAPLLAHLFAAPALTAIIRVASLGFLTRGVQVLPRGMLARRLDFRRLAWIDGLEALSLSLFTLVLALLGAKVWALVIGNLLGGVVGTALSFAWFRCRLTWPRDLRALASDVAFGGKVLGGQLAWYLYNNSDFAIVGRILGPQALGAYTVGWTLANVPVERVSGLVNRVTPAYFAALSHDRDALGRYLANLTQGLATITFPACLGLALVADDLVATLLGPTWAATAIALRLLALSAAVRSIFALISPILVFNGEVERNLRFSIACMIVLPLVFAVGTQWGIAGVAAAWVLVYPALAAVFLLRHALRAVGLRWGDYLRVLSTPTLATLVMGAGVLALRRWPAIPAQGIPRLAVECAGGAVLYLAAILLLAGERIRGTIALLRPATPRPTPSPGEGRPRLLVVSYHFPPDPAVGGLRWQKLAHHAVERGWQVEVISLDPFTLPRRDEDRLADLPPGTVIHHVSLPPARFAELPSRLWRLLRPAGRASRPPSAGARVAGSRAATELRWWPRGGRDLARAYFAWVDRERGARWGRAVADRARTLLASRSFDAIISCGPPHPPHREVARFAAAEGIPFVLDLRDPWSLLQRLPEAVASPWWLAWARADERRAIAASRLVVTATDAHRDRLRARHPVHARRIITVRNGCDEDPLPVRQRPARFTIAYTGSVYLDRDPAPFFRAAGRVVRELGLSPDDFGIEFMGEVATFDGVPVATLAAREGLEGHFRAHPPRPRREALEFLADAAMLLLLPQDSDMAIPAKLFEYARFPAALLVLATPESATGALLRDTTADLVAPEDIAGIADALRRRFEEFRRGVVPAPVAGDGRLSRSAQARILLDALEGVVAAAPTPHSGNGKEAAQGLQHEGSAIVRTADLPPVAVPVPAEEFPEHRQPRRRVGVKMEGAS